MNNPNGIKNSHSNPELGNVFYKRHRRIIKVRNNTIIRPPPISPSIVKERKIWKFMKCWKFWK
jgi:hypothetical protein